VTVTPCKTSGPAWAGGAIDGTLLPAAIQCGWRWWASKVARHGSECSSLTALSGSLIGLQMWGFVACAPSYRQAGVVWQAALHFAGHLLRALALCFIVAL